MRALAKAFEEAMAAGADYDAADRAWTEAIELAPLNSAAWSNRGTKRLQAGRWADARADLERSVELSPDPNNPDPLTLNNLGNAEGALGNWDAAMANYLEASKDPSREMESIALANLALAKFQVNDVDGSLRVARTILRRDPEFWDVRALATAALWASGRETDAEAEWQALCRSGRGFGAPVSAENARDGRGGIEGDVAYAARLLEQQVRLFQSLYQPVRAFRLTLRLTWSFVCRWRSKPRWFAGRSARTARGGTEVRRERGRRRRGRDGGKCPVSNVRVHGDRRAAVAAEMHRGAGRVFESGAGRGGARLRRRREAVRVLKVSSVVITIVVVGALFYINQSRRRFSTPRVSIVNRLAHSASSSRRRMRRERRERT